MKCRFCGKKLKKDAVYCSKCGKKQTLETLPEGEYDDYEEYVDVTYTDYEEPVDYNEFDPDSGYTPPVRPKKAKSGKFPLIPVLVGIAAVVVVLMLVLGNGSDGDEGRINNPTQGQTGHTQSKEEYPLYWPDFMLSLEEDTYTQELVTVLVTSKDEQNYGLQSYMGKVRVDQDHTDQIQEFVDMVQDECHFVLVAQENGRYYFRFQGSNAPVTMKSGDLEYHCIIATEQEDRGVMVTYQWMTDFSTNSSNAKMEPKQTAVKPMPEETKPTETKPVETKPVETKPVETKPVETKPVETEPSVRDNLTLPDPIKFFGCVRGEDQKHEDNGWMVSCKFDLDTGREVVSEFLALLESGEYPLEFICGEKQDYIRTSASLFTYYYFDYTGSSRQVKGLEKEHSQTKKMVHYDVRLAVYYNYRAGWILVSFYYDDAFTLKDYGDRVSRLPTDYTKASQQTLDSLDRGSNWNKDVLPCTACDGDGDCHRCNGNGYLWSRASDKENRNCWACNNSGICQTCYGTGKR